LCAFGKHECRPLALVEKREKEKSSSKSMQKKIFEESS
jgi:hypothetical protein